MKMGDMAATDNMSGMDGMKEKGAPASSDATARDMSGSKEKDRQGMAGTDVGHMKMGSDSAEHTRTEDKNQQAMTGTEMGSNTGTAPFPQPGPNTMPIMTLSRTANTEANLERSSPVRVHVGPQVDNVPMEVSERLNDPGDGLSGNGRRVLTYSDLRARYRGVDGRPPSRDIELHLSGNMERYIWGFNGQKFSSAEPIELKLGERVRFVLINDTMMEHPIHLHGLWSELENGHGEFNPYKQTIIVKPAERVSYLVSADTRGHWAFHCHLLYHMEAGMFRTVVVS
jgi:FtsP/CotA-like multicopper oxidase with cupredoxin domain